MKNFFITVIEGLCTLCEFILNIMGVVALVGVGAFMIYSVVSLMTGEVHIENSAEQRWLYPCIAGIMDDTHNVDWDTAQRECISQGPPEWFLNEW